MLNAVAMLAAAGSGEVGEGPQIATLSHSVSLTSTCPTSNNVTVTYTATSVQAGDSYKLYRIVNDGTPELVKTGSLSSGATLATLWGRRTDTEFGSIDSFRVRLDALRSSAVTGSKQSTNSSHEVASEACPE